MNYFKKLFILLFIISSAVFAQDKLFNNEDVVINSYSSLAPEKLDELHWIPGTGEYCYVKSENDTQTLISEKVNSKDSRVIVSLRELNNALANNNLPETKSFPKINWTSDSTFEFWNNNQLISFDTKDFTAFMINYINSDAENRSEAPNSKYTAFTIDNNLFVSTEPGIIKQITNEKDKNIVSGQSVSRNEFGITGGIFWSPNSKYLAFYQKDESMVTSYPLVDITTTPATLNNIKYPMAGQRSEEVYLAVYNIETGKTVWLETGEPKVQYLTCVTWGPENKFLYVAHLNRDQNHVRLIKYDASSGKQVKTLFEEKSDKYVECEHQLIFLPNDSSKFLWFSERDGWQQLYLYDSDGNLLKQATKGEWVITSFLGFDKSGENIFIQTTKGDPTQRHYYSVNLSSGNMKKLSSDHGTHKFISNSEGNYFIDNFNSTEVPNEYRIVNSDGEVVKEIMKADNPIKDYAVGKKEIFTIKGENNTDLYCQMIYPKDFDPNKKYPVIVYVYGGPHAQLVTDHWPFGRYDFWFYEMNQKGYIIFTLDNRGSDNRGLEFEQATFRRLGTKEVDDQLRGVEFLKSKKFVDPDRIGVYGWSYGGFMTTSLMLRGNDNYKVGVCGGAVIDWKYYEVMYTERYMDTPQTNPGGYKNASLLNYIDNLNGKLLLVHGTSDPTVVWQNTLSFAEAAMHNNKPLDYFPYLGYPHHVYGKDALHLYNKITNYFLDNL